MYIRVDIFGKCGRDEFTKMKKNSGIIKRQKFKPAFGTKTTTISYYSKQTCMSNKETIKDQTVPLVQNKFEKLQSKKCIRLEKQNSVDANLSIAKLPFQRLVKRVVGKFKDDARFEKKAVMALQEAAETYLVGLFEDSCFCAASGKKLTLTPRHIRMMLNSTQLALALQPRPSSALTMQPTEYAVPP